MPATRMEATIRAGALPSAERPGAGKSCGEVAKQRRLGCLAARGHCVDDAVVLEEHGEARIVPTGDGRLAYGRMLLDGCTKVLLDLGHRAAALRSVHAGITQGEL